MKYRALIFDDNKEIRRLLRILLDLRKYEVFTFPHPGLCPLLDAKTCPCGAKRACADMIISDLQMPFMNGLELINAQKRKGCKCSHFALMSGYFSQKQYAEAQEAGVAIFVKPFRMDALTKCLGGVENDIDPDRRLADWYLEKTTILGSND